MATSERKKTTIIIEEIENGFIMSDGPKKMYVKDIAEMKENLSNALDIIFKDDK